MRDNVVVLVVVGDFGSDFPWVKFVYEGGGLECGIQFF